MLIAHRNGMVSNKKSEADYWGLCFTAEEAGSVVSMTGTNDISLLYSIDLINWYEFIPGTTSITLQNIDDKVWIKAGVGGNTTINTSAGSHKFQFSKLTAASGNIMSILNGEEQLYTISSSYCFYNLFGGVTTLTSAPMLPATTPATRCYQGMFYHCTSLTKVYVPAFNLMSGANSCCQGMFDSTAITSITIPTVNVIDNCFRWLLSNCSQLTEIHVDFTSFGNTPSWVNGVASTGTFYCPTALGTNETIQRGINYCPTGWTVINTDAA